jgi:hypothetical protein
VYTPNPREIREINIPVKKDEELRSVDDQLKKIPNPWERKASTSSVIKLQKVNHTPCMYNSIIAWKYIFIYFILFIGSSTYSPS